MQEIYWSPRSDFMPEYVIDYDSVKFTTLVESKPIGKSGENAEYYPGFIFSFKAARNPFPIILLHFMPSIILGLCLISCFEITRFDLNNRLTNLSVTLLSIIAIMKESKSNLPEIKNITYAD